MPHRMISSLLMSLVLAVPTAASAQAALKPTQSCITFDADAKLLTAYFGYTMEGPSGSERTISIGDDNFFSPGVVDRGQPHVFRAGIHERVFVTSFQASSSQTQITWYLAGETATARPAPVTAECAPGRYRGPWDPSALYTWNDLVLHTGLLWVFNSTFGSPGELSGEPGLVQSSWLLFDARRGSTGPEGPQGPQGPAGTPGANGARGIQGEPGPPGAFNFAACTTRTATATARLLQTAVATVQAPAGSRIFTGGGTCETGIMPANGMVNPTTWQVKCVGGRATATALVCPG